jgi:hypothetical protein
VEALLEKDAHDESLRRYKEQLLGSAAHGDRGGMDTAVYEIKRIATV